LTNITLTKSDGETIELTLAEARALHDQLSELFCDKSPHVIIERDHYPRPWHVYRPLWCEAPRSPRLGEVRCVDPTSNLSVLYSGNVS
jgi:hypothetical protein